MTQKKRFKVLNSLHQIFQLSLGKELSWILSSLYFSRS